MCEKGPGSRHPRVGYVLKKYPRLSETFILNEILGLEALGVPVSIYSLRTPDEGRWHADLARVRTTACYLPEFRSQHVYDAFAEIVKMGGHAALNLDRMLCFLDRLPANRRAGMLVQGLHLAKRVREDHLDHLHAHFMTIAAHTVYLAHCATGVPFSVTAHAKDIFRESVDRDVFREVADAASRIVTVTDYNTRFIADRFLDGDTTKVRRIYNGLPIEAFEEAAVASGSSASGTRPRDGRLILAVGRLVEKKGFHILLEACRLLADRKVPFHCRIVGDGEDRPRLDELRRRLRLESQVELTGAQPRERVVAEMVGASVLAAPCVASTDGNQDALPTVLLEALALGLPCVSTRLSGIPEILDHDVDGLLCAPGNAAELAHSIEALLLDASRRRQFADAGREKAAERFDRRKTLPELLETFGGAVTRRESMAEEVG